MTIVKRILLNSYWRGFAVGAFKIGMAILSHSVLLLIHAVYSIIKACALCFAAKSRSQDSRILAVSGWLVIEASAVYLIYSIYIYAFGCASAYPMYIAIGIAALTTCELTSAIHGLCSARKQKETRQETIRYVSLASALISVSLTQTAILSFALPGDASRYYALGDAIFGFLALIVGAGMCLRAGIQKSERKEAHGSDRGNH